MRDFKFRVWDTEEEKFINNCAFEDYQPLNDIFKNHWYVFLQYTGLKDENGIEIYEGDVVRCEFEKENAIVSFEEGSFVVDFESANYAIERLLSEFYKDVQVIGNIYENPELIQDKKDEH